MYRDRERKTVIVITLFCTGVDKDIGGVASGYDTDVQ